MKTQIKNLLFLILTILFVFEVGCNTPKPKPNPLAGWWIDANHEPNSTIVKDYQGYIHTLSSEEQKFATFDYYYEDGKGQHAVLITVGLNGINWRHVLIYDKGNKRIKTIKYASGDSHS